MIVFAVLRIIHLVFLLKYVVACLGEKLLLKLGASTVCVVNLYPQNLVT